MQIIKHSKTFLSISAVLVIASWVLVAILGLQQGIDLKGGTEWHLEIQDEAATPETITKLFKENVTIKRTEENGFILRLKELSEEEHRTRLTELKKEFEKVREQSFTSIGPSIGSELRAQALTAGVLVILGISLYVIWAFRKVKEPIASWKYGLATLITLFHDISVPMALLAILGKTMGIEIDTNFIVALLVIMGFSVHDTIVVFDRTRENLLDPEMKKRPLEDVFNASITQTLARSINTSLTLVFVLMTLAFWGPGSIFYFILTILVGSIVGTYSSVCVASPLIYLWSKKEGEFLT